MAGPRRVQTLGRCRVCGCIRVRKEAIWVTVPSDVTDALPGPALWRGWLRNPIALLLSGLSGLRPRRVRRRALLTTIPSGATRPAMRSGATAATSSAKATCSTGWATTPAPAAGPGGSTSTPRATSPTGSSRTPSSAWRASSANWAGRVGRALLHCPATGQVRHRLRGGQPSAMEAAQGRLRRLRPDRRPVRIEQRCRIPRGRAPRATSPSIRKATRPICWPRWTRTSAAGST